MGVGKKNPDKEFGKHEDPAFQDYHAQLGEQIKDPAFTKAAIAAEDAPPPKQKKKKQHKAVKKKKRAAKKKPSLGKKALAIHIAHAIAKAEKKKKADTINVISRPSDRRMAYDEVDRAKPQLVQGWDDPVGKKNPDKEFGKHEDPAFQDYHAQLGEQIKDPAFTKAAIAAEDAPPLKQKKKKQHKAVKKKKHAKKKPSLGKKALAIHIAHAIAKAEKKKKADTINVISSRSDRRMAYDEVGGPATLVQHRHPNPDKAFVDDEDPAFAAEGGHGAVNDPAFTAPGSPLDTLETSKHHRDLQAEQKKKLVKNGLADPPMANKIVDSVTGHGGKIDDQWSTKKKKKKPTKKKAPKSTLQKEKRALAEGARYQRMGKETHKKASAHEGKKHSKSVKMKA